MAGGEMRRYPLRGGAVTPKEAADRFGISIKSVYARLQKNGGDMEKLYQYYEMREGRGMRDASRNTDVATAKAEAELLKILTGEKPGAEVKKLGDEFKPYVPPAQAEAAKRDLLRPKKPDPEPEAPVPEIKPLDMTVARDLPLPPELQANAGQEAGARELPVIELPAIEEIEPFEIPQYARPIQPPDKHAGKRAELRRVNAAIEAMGALEGEPGRGVVLPNSLERQMREAREEMRKWRMVHYADLVDWEAIARGNGNA